MIKSSNGSRRAAGEGGTPFIDSHRARGICVKQRSRLFAQLASRVRSLHEHGLTEAAVVRPSLDRYIAQLGPVALTVAWLRSHFDTVPEGELLTIVWRGFVAPPGVKLPEHHVAKPMSPPSVLSEEVVLVVAASEETWRWRSKADDAVTFTTDELAERYVERLRVAYADALSS